MAIKICECGWTMQRINGVWFCADCDRKPKDVQPEIDLDKVFEGFRAWLKMAKDDLSRITEMVVLSRCKYGCGRILEDGETCFVCQEINANKDTDIV